MKSSRPALAVLAVALLGGVSLASVTLSAIDDPGSQSPPAPPELLSSSWTMHEFAPSRRISHSAVHDPGSDRMVIFGGSGAGNKGDAWVLENATGLGGPPRWTRLSPGGTPPSARSAHSAVYDSSSKRMIVFGGYDSIAPYKNDVWVLDYATALGGVPAWAQLAPTGTPPVARDFHSAVYDAASNRMVVFGGLDGISYRNDVWVLENATGLAGTPRWSMLTVAGTPPSGRLLQSAVRDPGSNRLVMFGGNDPARKNDAWVLENATGLGGAPKWTALAPTGTPPSPRDGHTAVLDSASGRMVVFGGNDGALKNDVWALENATGLGGPMKWTPLAPAGAPPTARERHTSIFDDASERMIMFGMFSAARNDLWLLANATGAGGGPAWTLLAPAGAPPSARYSHSAVFAAASDRVIVFGGFDGARKNDLWVLQNATGAVGTPTWMQTFPSGTPPTPRSRHTAVYAAASDRMIVFGGNDAGGTSRKVWLLENASGVSGSAKWTEIPAWIVFPLEGHSAVYDAASNRMIVFGGFDSAIRRREVHVLENASGLGGTPVWNQLAPSGTLPSWRDSHASIFDAASNRMVVFGGFDGARKNDVWVLQNATELGGIPKWTQLAPAGTPPSARGNHSAVYEAATNRLISFGGNDGVQKNDVWVLQNATGVGGAPRWAQHAPTGTPPSARSRHAAVYDVSSGRMVAVGGQTTTYNGESWVLSEMNGVDIPEVESPALVVIVVTALAIFCAPRLRRTIRRAARG